MLGNLKDSVKEFSSNVKSAVAEKELEESDVTPLLEELRLKLLKNNVSLEVAEEIEEEIKEKLLGETVGRGNVEEKVEDAFREYSHAVGGGRGVEVVGVYVVGSSLSDEFDSGRSDLDLYVHLSEEYDKSEGFERLLNDPSEQWTQSINSILPEEFQDVDVLGCVTDDSSLRTPNKYIEK